MENTADLAMVQKMIIDTLHKEGKSQRVITERGAVQGVLYQSIINAKLTGRKKLGMKMCTSNRDDCKLENTVKQSRYKHLGELLKSVKLPQLLTDAVTLIKQSVTNIELT